MIKLTVGIKGMACGMCETHINEAVRNAFQVKKVTSSHTKKQTMMMVLAVTLHNLPEGMTVGMVYAGCFFGDVGRKALQCGDFSKGQAAGIYETTDWEKMRIIKRGGFGI